MLILYRRIGDLEGYLYCNCRIGNLEIHVTLNKTQHHVTIVIVVLVI